MLKDVFRKDLKDSLENWTNGFSIDNAIAPIDKIIIEVPFNGKESLMYWLIASTMFFREDCNKPMTKESVFETVDNLLVDIVLNSEPSILSPEIPLWKYHLLIAEQAAKRFGIEKRYPRQELRPIVVDFISAIIHMWCFLGGEVKTVKPIFAVPEGWTMEQINNAIKHEEFYLTFIGTEEPTELEEDSQ